MKRAAALLLVLLASVVCPGRSFADIFEVADNDGNVTHYKYTDKKGSVVFTDTLANIPEEYRKKNKVVRIGPPPRKKEAPAAEPPAAEAPPPAEAPAAPRYQVQPDATSTQGEAAGGTLWLIIGLALAVTAGVGGFLVYRRVSGSRQPAVRRQGSEHPGRDRGPSHPTEPRREPRGAQDDRAQRPDAGSRPRERPEESLQRLLQARDFAAAARLCESLGDLVKAAACHLEAGNPVRAREIYVELRDYRHAAELFEKAGDFLKAGELFEAAFLKEGPPTHAGAGSDSARRSGQLFEKAGVADKAAAVYLKAGLSAEAAVLLERGGDFLQAAEQYLKAGNPEKAAECFEKAGDPARGYAALATLCYDRGRVAEAAAYSEKAGDLMQAATMYQEAGNFAKAGELFFQSGFFTEAAESFTLINDLARAAEAHEQAGNYLLAAQAFETVGIDKERLATLYEKGEGYYAAGRLFVKLGQLDRALNVLQLVDGASPDYAAASLLVGMIFLKRGLTDPAFEKFLKIIDNQPIGKSNLEPYYFLALCYEKVGDAEKAKSIFTRILAEDYNYRDVRKRVGQ
jgi:tetratricopeptide (TPR) repeat protein